MAIRYVIVTSKSLPHLPFYLKVFNFVHFLIGTFVSHAILGKQSMYVVLNTLALTVGLIFKLISVAHRHAVFVGRMTIKAIVVSIF